MAKTAVGLRSEQLRRKSLQCRGWQDCHPAHASEQKQRLEILLSQQHVPHLWKHSEYFLIDVKDAACVHFVLEFGSQRSVLLGGEEEGWGVAAPRQSSPKEGETGLHGSRQTLDPGKHRVWQGAVNQLLLMSTLHAYNTVSPASSRCHACGPWPNFMWPSA